MNTQTLLVELLTEEIPPGSLNPLAKAFARGVFEALGAAQFLSPDSQLTHFATPRRLAFTVTGVLGRSPDRTVREKIMPVAVALDHEGAPTAALKKKLAALKLEHVSVTEFERAIDGKAESFFYRHTAPGQELADCLGLALAEVLAKLPAQKSMRYQLHAGRSDESNVQFVRPARSLIALWGDRIVPVRALGLLAGRSTRGHRFLSEGPLEIETAEGYVRTLHEGGRVVVGFEDRRDAIREGLIRAAQGSVVLLPEDLLDEVTALVEWPAVYEGSFDPGFLVVPQECLILTMQQNQRYFALTDETGNMQNRFLVVSNIATADPSSIISGNERVLRARLSDARFFFEQDQKKSLVSRLPLLDKVVYHHVLGSLGARVRRLAAIAVQIADMLGADRMLVERAALLSKADLVTGMVGEFPELQGIMGRYYALHDAEPAEVARAIEDHYRPRFAKDPLPESLVALCVALADKLEIIVGLFGVGNVPSGDRDPYALRRHALGVARILVEKKLPLQISELLEIALASFAEIPQMKRSTGEIREFLYERLRSLLKEAGYTSAEVEAVVSLAPERIDVLPEQLLAVRSFNQMPEAASLAAANKRIGNILKKAEQDDSEVVNELLIEPAEQALAGALSRLQPEVRDQFGAGDYTGMLKSLSALRAPVDAFFDQVMVMAPEAHLRRNRIALLGGLHRMMNRFADLSKLAA